MLVPKIIMQTWKNEIVPDKWKTSVESIKKFMPDWKHVLMTDQDNLDFCKLHFPEFYDTFVKFQYPIQRADAIRYMWLYINGGVYMDLDLELVSSLEELFDQGKIFLVPSGNVGSWYTNSFMASAPRQDFWLDCIEAMKKSTPWYMSKHFTVMFSTGPGMLTGEIKKFNEPFVRLPPAELMPCSVCENPCVRTGKYLRNLEGQSWNSWDSTVLNCFLCNWNWMVLVLVSGLILCLIVWLVIKYTPVSKVNIVS